MTETMAVFGLVSDPVFIGALFMIAGAVWCAALVEVK
jgi:formate hydrogenlyase subunit 3/multisubunit Na+/H+ antiporter MnhD subunit